MRSIVLNGTGERRRSNAHGVALVNGPLRNRTINGDGVDLGAITEALSHVMNVLRNATDFFNIGPGYDSTNGGEVLRQLQAIPGDLQRPYAQPYMHWLKNYRPAIWNSGNIWQTNPDIGIAHRSRWKDHYEALLAAGLPPGTILDANMVPSGLGAAQAAANGAQTVVNSNVPPTAQEMVQLNLLAMQIAGGGTEAQRLEAIRQVSTMPATWQQYVASMVAVWQQVNNADTTTDAGGPPPIEPPPGETSDNTGTLVLVGAAALGLILATR